MDRNDRWVSKNFTRLVDLYGGRAVAVENRRIVAVGRRPEQAERRAREAGAKEPVVVRVPSKERLKLAFAPVRLFDLS